MIALDTNILVRYFSGEEGRDAVLATRLIEAELSDAKPGFVSEVTVCEIVWVLRNRYGFGYDAQSAVLRLLLDAPQLFIEHEASVALALASGHPDLADGIIHFVGEQAGCSRTVTLDKKFARLPGVELLA